ncbi:MAG TPA: glycosyltransferase family 39 protein [Candidatus Bathyarchaeia archaeon]|nr:glycosyltransferase family 39 protein [Candidatus Bathyarchaeia archaeon]
MTEVSAKPRACEPIFAESPALAADRGPRRRAILVLTLLTLAGAWLRLWHLGSKSLWLDEGATVALARTSWPHFAWVWWHGEASLQTIYFLLMRGWVQAGLSETWLRLPAALFGIASIPLLYAVARKFAGTSVALAAAALLTFSPTHVDFSQEARSYTLGILLVLAATYFFVLAVERDRPRDWALWTICGMAAFYTHDFTALVLGAQAAALFFGPSPAPWRRFLVCAAIIFFAAIPGLTYIFRAPPENLHFTWMPRPSAREIRHLAMFFGGGGVKAAIALLLWIAGAIAILRKRREYAFWRGVLLLLWAILPATILGLISLREPLFLQRYMVFSLPATVLLAAMGMDGLRKWRLGLLLVVALCAFSLSSIAKQYSRPREDWRGASHLVLVSASPGDAVVFFPFYTRNMLDYYRDRYGASAPLLRIFAPGFYSGGEDARNLRIALDRNPHQFRQVWVLVARKKRMQDFEEGAAVAERLQSIFGAPAEHKFADVTVLQFGR